MPVASSNDLVGWARGSPSGTIIEQRRGGNCAEIRRCPGILAAAATNHSGGTAYDPSRQALFCSNGTELALFSARDCKSICNGTATLALGAGSQVSGLALANRSARLFQLDTVPGRFGLVVYDVRSLGSGCPRGTSLCTATTATAAGLAGGLAYDEGRDLLYIAVTERSGGTSTHYVHVVRPTTPCTTVCRFPIPTSCLSSSVALTGLAFDDCDGELYVTEGRSVLTLRVTDPLRCAFTVGSCCAAAGPYGGLAIRSGWTLAQYGKSCTIAPCASCPEMHLTLTGGDPAIGNQSFGIALSRAPGGGTAGLFLGIGCGRGLQYFCSSFYADPRFGPYLTPIAGTGCSGSARWPAPLAADPTTCGVKICVQAVLVCPPSGSPGVGLSQALEFSITN